MPKWISAVNRKDWVLTEYNRLCSEHFIRGKQRLFFYQAFKNLSTLPKEVVFMIFDNMEIKGLGKLSFTSKNLHDLVCEYMLTKNGCNKLYNVWIFEKCLLHPNCFHKNKALDAGYFFRKLIAFLPIKDKIHFVWKVLHKSRCMKNEQCSQPNLFFGTFVQALMENWTMEQIKVGHNAMEAKSGKLKLLNDVLKSREGSQPENENSIRSYYRCLYWAAVPEYSRARWLSLILDKQPYCFQAKLLLLLFSPIDTDGNIVWNAFSKDQNEGSINSRVSINAALKELAEAFHFLHCRNVVSIDRILTLIDEITVIPDYWLRHNICQFIMCTGAEILQYVLRGYLICAQYEEFIHFVILCTVLPICQTQAEYFSELVTRSIDWLAVADRSTVLEQFFEFIDQHKHTFSGNRGVRTLTRAIQRKFTLRKSKRLALKRLRSTIFL